MSKISNKSQLTARYNRRDVENENQTVCNVNSSRQKVYDTIARECNRKYRSRIAVNASRVYKANDYDIEKESQRLYRLQCKYNTSNFEEIELRKKQRAADRLKASSTNVNKDNRIARIKSAQAASVAVFNKSTLSGAFAFQSHANIVRMAMG